MLVDDNIIALCKQGAEVSAAGMIPRFKVMGCEVEQVRHYMAKHYPHERYLINWPTPEGIRHDAVGFMGDANAGAAAVSAGIPRT